MAKYKDKHSMGKSEICPHKKKESGRQRHARRLETALLFEAKLRAWCLERGLPLQVKNGGHHWIIRGDINVEWWPSSAKAVTGWAFSRFRNGIHCHDYEQLKRIIEREIQKGLDMNKRTRHEWNIETVDSNGDVTNSEQMDHLDWRRMPLSEDQRLVLVKIVTKGQNAKFARAVVTNGKLPEKWEDGGEVPKMYRNELAKGME